jgi:trigger factor
MKVLNVEEVSKTKRKLTLQIDPEDIVSEAEEAYEELEKEAELPGFRKGRVPRRFLEYRFDKNIQKEAFNESVQKALEDAAKTNELKTVGIPDFDEAEFDSAREKIAEGPAEVSVTVEVVPEFDLPEYKGVKLEVPPYFVDEEMIDRIIASQLEGQAHYEPVDDRPTKEGDFLVIDVKATRGDKELPGLSDDQMFLSGLCCGQTPRGFDEGLLNLNKGDRFEFDFDLQSDYPLYEEVGNNSIHVKGRVHQVSVRSLPKLDNDFAKDLGHESLEDYRSAIRRQLEEYGEGAVARGKTNRVIEYLLDNTDVSVPVSLIQSNYRSMKYRRQMEAAQQGEDEALLTAEARSRIEMNTMFHAERGAKRELILLKIAEKEGITVSDDEYYDAMRVRARALKEDNLDRFLADIDRRGLEDFYKETILIEKTTAWLVKSNEFETVEPSKGKGAA